MPSPKSQELGLKSPKRLRGGIDFPTWEGINLKNDSGAIRDTQFTSLINGRIDGNEVISRGGEAKIHTQALDGCIYGMIDIPDGAVSFLLGTQGAALSGSIIRYYSGSSPLVNPLSYSAVADPQTLIQGLGSSYPSPTLPRRVLARYEGAAYCFGALDDGTTQTSTLFKIVLPETTATNSGTASVSNQTKFEPVVELPSFNSWCTIKENVDQSTDADATIKEILYIGAHAVTGAVYRWDGTNLLTEDSGLPAGPIIVVPYADDVWAVAANKLRKRNGGAWDIEYTLPTSNTAFCATEYLNLLIIGSGRYLQVFNGATFSTHDTGGALYKVYDIKVFNNFAYYLWQADSGVTQTLQLGRTDGSTFDDTFYFFPYGDNDTAGALETAGFYLYVVMASDGTTPRLLQVSPGDAPITPLQLAIDTDGLEVSSDLLAF